jgi:phosphotransferase system enzyme I (PtsI)
MSASAILNARKLITSYSTKELQAMADQAMSFTTVKEIEDFMKAFVSHS